MTYFDAQRFGIHVKAARGKRGLHMAAEEIGCSASTLSRIERGANDVDLYTFLAICDWLKLSPSIYIVQSEETAQSKIKPGDPMEHIEFILRTTTIAPEQINAVMVILRSLNDCAGRRGGAQ